MAVFVWFRRTACNFTQSGKVEDRKNVLSELVNAKGDTDLTAHNSDENVLSDAKVQQNSEIAKENSENFREQRVFLENSDLSRVLDGDKTIKKRGEFHNWPLREFFEKEIYRMKRERRSKPPWIPCSFQSSRWR